MQLLILGFYNTSDERNCDYHRIIIAENSLPRSLDDRGITPVDPCRQNILELRHMQIPGEAVAALEVEQFRVDRLPVRPFFSQILQRRNTIDSQDLIGLHESESVQDVGSRIGCSDSRSEEGF